MNARRSTQTAATTAAIATTAAAATPSRGLRGALRILTVSALCASAFASPLAGVASAQAGAAEPTASRIEVEIAGLSPDGPVVFDAIAYTGGLATTSDTVSSTGGGATTIRPTFDDLTVIRRRDGVSQKLSAFIATGRHMPSVIIRVFDYDPAQEAETLALQITATDVIVVSNRMSATTVPDPSIGNERVGFKYTKILYEYPNDGVRFGWDRRTSVCTGC